MSNVDVEVHAMRRGWMLVLLSIRRRPSSGTVSQCLASCRTTCEFSEFNSFIVKTC